MKPINAADLKTVSEALASQYHTTPAGKANEIEVIVAMEATRSNFKYIETSGWIAFDCGMPEIKVCVANHLFCTGVKLK